jgi:hypothetical protein
MHKMRRPYKPVNIRTMEKPMFSSGADIDIKKLEEEIRKEIEEKRKKLFTDEELEELQNLELKILPNPDRIRTYFLKELEFEKPDLQFYKTDYNIDLNTFVYSSNSGFLMKLRSWFKPFFRLYGNIDALIYKQANFNREQTNFNSSIVHILEKPFHYIRVLHTLINYQVAEMTKLSLQQQMLKSQVEALAYDVDQLRKRERLLEKMAVLKEEEP